jgi:hypothetical protein
MTWHAVLLLAGAVGVTAGTGLLVIPSRALNDESRLRVWLFDMDVSRLLDTRYSVERPVYRRHRIFGTVVMLTAGTGLAILWTLHPLLVGRLAESFGFAGIRTVLFTAWAIASLTLVIGFILLARPSALKPLEAGANRWIEPFGPVWTSFRRGRGTVQRMVVGAPRLTGLTLLTGGALCFLALFD